MTKLNHFHKNLMIKRHEKLFKKTLQKTYLGYFGPFSPIFFRKTRIFLDMQFEQKVGATLAGFEIIISHWPLTDCEPILSGL